jgi:hypothetical protein
MIGSNPDIRPRQFTIFCQGSNFDNTAAIRIHSCGRASCPLLSALKLCQELT